MKDTTKMDKETEKQNITLAECVLLGIVLLVPTIIYVACSIAVLYKIIALIVYEDFRCELFMLMLLGVVLFTVIWYYTVGKIIFTIICPYTETLKNDSKLETDIEN